VRCATLGYVVSPRCGVAKPNELEPVELKNTTMIFSAFESLDRSTTKWFDNKA
jgi:hypothetical protein